MLKHLNIPTILLISFLTRLMITGASIGEALTIIGLCGLYGYNLWIESKKALPVNKEILERIIYLEEQSKLYQAKLGAMAISSAQMRR